MTFEERVLEMLAELLTKPMEIYETRNGKRKFLGQTKVYQLAFPKLPEIKSIEATPNLLVFPRREGDTTIIHVVELPPAVVEKYFKK